ncbi:MAG: helix-turn-helix transcriptional regulator [Pseudomonadota bacterium]
MGFSLAICTGLLGLFIAFPLLAMRRKRPANFWLGMFVFSLSWLSLADLYAIWPHAFGLFDWPLTGIGAFFYCYVRSMTGLGNGRRQGWHFLPLAAWSFALLGARLFVPIGALLRWLNQGGEPVFATILLASQLLACAYAVAVLWRLAQYRRRVRANYASTTGRDLNWLRGVAIMLLVLLALWLPATLLGGIWGWGLVLGRLVTLYFMGWSALRQHEVFLPPPEPEPADKNDKYARSGMHDAAAQLIGERLARRALRERDFLDGDIKLTDLAERIGTSPQLLSQYLNDVQGVNFFDYINGLRVAEVQKMMGDPAHAERSLLELAFAAGFNSKSTFNASFKKITGMAPSHWRAMASGTSVPIG